jgi:hypothetical protein
MGSGGRTGADARRSFPLASAFRFFFGFLSRFMIPF